MTEKTDAPIEDDGQALEINREELYAQLEKWQAARKFNQQLQAQYSQEVTKWREVRDKIKDDINAIREAALKEK
jgi:septation ring formation regulator EzrA